MAALRQCSRAPLLCPCAPRLAPLCPCLPCLTSQGGLLPASDWDSLDRDWLSPVSRGSLLPDFALEGPVDVYLTQPTALQVGTACVCTCACSAYAGGRQEGGG